MSNRIIVEDFSAIETANRADCVVWSEAERRGCEQLGANATCETAVALILAYDTATTPLNVMFDDPQEKPVVCGEDGKTPRPLQEYEGEPVVARAVRTARSAGFLAVQVLGPDDAEAYERVAQAVAKADADATCIRYSSDAAADAKRRSRSYELYGIPEYVLETGRDLLRETPGAKRLMVLASDMVRVEARHLGALIERMDAKPTLDIVASWTVWLRRLPILLSGEFLEGLEARCEKTQALGYPYRLIEQLEIEDVVYCEEKLAANGTQAPALGAFFKECKLSALAAVLLAKSLERMDEDERAAAVAGLTDADRMLLAEAEDACTALEEVRAMDDELDRDVAWAQGWGARNKLDFPLFASRASRDKLVFLDSAATAQRVDTAIEAQHAFDCEENANVYRGGYDLSMQATFTLNDARKAVEDFLGVGRRETVYTANTTGGANLVAQCWGDVNISEGDLIVTSIAEHHSNSLPWMLLAERRRARLAYLPLDESGRYDLEAYAELLEQRPKIVALAQAGNVLGIANPIAKMTTLAKKAGAVVYVDGAQGMPHQATKIPDLGCDFYAFSAHKLYGPMGIGGVWINPERFGEMQPVALGGGAVSHVGVGSYYLRLGAIAYENGTPAVSQAVGLAAAVRYLEALGMDNVERHGAILTRYLMRGLRDIEGLSVFGDHESSDGECGLVSFGFAGLGPGETGAYLGKLGVAVRSGGHCALPLAASIGVVGTTRISFGVYNTAEDVEAACTALRVLRKLVG